MSERTCHNCVYACGDVGLWLRCLAMGEPILPRCANHPRWPGTLREVPGVPCRNFRPRPTVPQGDVRLIPLGDGCYTYVDAADYEWLSQWNWHLDSGYAARYDNRKAVFMHRMIMQPPPGKVVDHIDGNRANNCRFNLRVCTRAQNSRNKRKQSGSYSVFKGVFYRKDTRQWFAKCRYQGKAPRLGYFDDEREAARAYDRMAVEWFGEYARLNFPEEWPPERRQQIHPHRPEASSEGNIPEDKAQNQESRERRPSRSNGHDSKHQ